VKEKEKSMRYKCKYNLTTGRTPQRGQDRQLDGWMAGQVQWWNRRPETSSRLLSSSAKRRQKKQAKRRKTEGKNPSPRMEKLKKLNMIKRK